MMDRLFIHRCNIQTRTGTENDFGEPVYSWADTYKNVPCRFANPKGAIRRLDTGEFVMNLPKLFLKHDQPVEEENRIVSANGFSGTYEVMKVNERYDGSGKHHKELDLKAVI